MHIKEFLQLVFQSLLLHKYKELVQKQFRHAVQFFFLIIIFGILIMCLLLIPKIIFFQESIGNSLGQFDSLKITLDVRADHPVKLMDHPTIVLDYNKSKLTNEDVLITEQFIYYKTHPLLKTKAINFTADYDVLQHKEAVQKNMLLLFMLILPAVLVIIFAISIIKYIVLMLVLTILAWIIARIRQSGLKFATILKVSTFTLTIPVIFDIVLLPYLRIWWLSPALYVLFFSLALLTLSEKSFSEMKHKDLFRKGKKKREEE
ncbi:MAG: DUF1189 family protein [archaeon]